MQRLKVSGAVRPVKWSLGVKWLKIRALYKQVMCQHFAENPAITLGQCVQTLKRRTRQNKVVLKGMCVFISFRRVGLKGRFW